MSLQVKKILSYFVDIFVEQTSSEINEKLLVYLSNGRFILNAGNCNYSYGSLHRAFQVQFQRMNLHQINIKNALILGFGAGSVASILLEEYKKNCRITGVEKDKKILELGHKYFNIQRFLNTEITRQDALDFFENNLEEFDFIVFDIYIGNDVPAEFETEHFLRLLYQSMTQNALLVFNKYYYNNQSKESADLLVDLFKRIYPKVRIYENNGYMIVAYKMFK